MYIDHSVYPDLDDLPEELSSIEDKGDYVHRICSAWDFGVWPEPATFALFSQWKEAFDRFPQPTSLGFHTFRELFGWEPIVVPEGLHFPEPNYKVLDDIEGRGPDPCEDMV